MRRSLRASLMFGMVILILLMIGQAVMGIMALHQTRVTSSVLSSDLIPSVRVLGEIQLEATRLRLRISRHAATNDPAKMAEIEGQVEAARAALKERFERYERLLSDERDRRVWREFKAGWDASMAQQREALAASLRGDKATAVAMIEDTRDAFLGATGILAREIAEFDVQSAAASQVVERTYANAVQGVVVSGGVAVLAGLAIWFLVVHGSVTSIQDLTSAMRAVAGGELKTPIPALDRADEIGIMAKTLVYFRDRLAEAEVWHERQHSIDLDNLKAMEEAKLQLARRAELLDQKVARKKSELIAREREIVWRLSRATERRDNETGDHIVRMACISGIIAEALGMSEEDCRLVEIAAQMHDIGKVGIPDQILFKPGPFTPEERKIMETHALIGWDILKGSESRLIRMAADVAGYHHEKWDGTGYPHGVAGEEIPLCGRIAAVADVFDALMSRRPYKEPWTLERAQGFILENAGTHFDPSCVDAFMARWDKIAAVAGTSASEVGDLRIGAAA